MPQLPKWSLALWVSGLLVTILILTPTSAAWIQGIDDQVFDVVSGNETQWLVAVAEFFDVIGGTVAMTTLP